MKNGKLLETLAYLDVTASELALLLDLNLRTIQRWLSGEVDIPKSVRCLLESWSTLQYLGLPWRPDGLNLLDQSIRKKQLELHMQTNIELIEVIKKVKARGGPSAPWSVDISRKKANLENMWISFYILPNGGFVPQSYGRSDKKMDFERDRNILEDGFFCIAEKIRNQRVLLSNTQWEYIEI
jgi:hypothetical protein